MVGELLLCWGLLRSFAQDRAHYVCLSSVIHCASWMQSCWFCLAGPAVKLPSTPCKVLLLPHDVACILPVVLLHFVLLTH